jgi:AAA+ superfamily predicted ATPase
MTLPAELVPHVDLVRLRLEAAVTARINAGYGGAGGPTPTATYLRDDAARERLGRDALRPEQTHADQAEELADAIDAAEAELELHRSPLTVARDRFALSPAEAGLLELAVAYELDADCRDLCAAVTGSRRAGLVAEVLLELASDVDEAALWRALRPEGSLRRDLLLEVDDRSGATTAASIRVTGRTVAWMLGEARIAGDVAAVMTLLAPADRLDVYLEDDVVDRIDAVAGALKARDAGEAPPMVLVQGPLGAGKRAVAQRIAAALGRSLAVLELPDLVDATRRGDPGVTRRALAEARLRGAVPYLAGLQALDGDDARDAAAPILAAARSTDALLLLSTREPRIPSVPIDRPFLLVRLPRPTLDTRREAWAAGLAHLPDASELPDDAASLLAARYVVGPGTIGEVLREARSFARATGEPVRMTGIEEAIGRRLTLRLGAFGQLISRRASFDQMVLPDDVIDTLQDMIAMVRERATILESWGYASHLGISRGVSALFSGEPGTGKTMAASVISSELGMDLIRIDLSSVVSKWVGETEKHLAKIFDEAQTANAMLVFDEADSLFGKRTEVKSAQDRYANLEVNYVLQRMETFDGICILTSNLEASIDPAFLRRLNFRVRFPKPDVDERIKLWRVLLPPEVALPDHDFSKLAKTFEMTGGHIKNAIVRAAVVAARDGRRLEPRDLIAGAHLEYLELGKVMPSFS